MSSQDERRDGLVRVWCTEHQRRRVNRLKGELDLTAIDGAPTQDDVLARALDLLEEEMDDELEEFRRPHMHMVATIGGGNE